MTNDQLAFGAGTHFDLLGLQGSQPGQLVVVIKTAGQPIDYWLFVLYPYFPLWSYCWFLESSSLLLSTLVYQLLNNRLAPNPKVFGFIILFSMFKRVPYLPYQFYKTATNNNRSNNINNSFFTKEYKKT